MKLKIFIATLSLVLIVTGISGCDSISRRETLTQISTIDAILNGLYDGVITVGELQKYGDFGIGTFEGLDGEMLEFDGKAYQVKADGIAHPVTARVKTPFASMTYFDNDINMNLPEGITYLQLQEYIDSKLPTENIFYAIKITGTFSYMKTRSVPAQQKPYPPLVEVTKNQPVFEFNNIKGTIVGFRCPSSYVNGVNVPGYHLHFLNEGKNAGGHILDFKTTKTEASIDNTSDFKLILPGQDSDFYKLDLTPDKSGDLQKAEK